MTQNILADIRNIITKIQPHYERLNLRYSKVYLQGSDWYVGDDLVYWWDHCNNIGYYRYNMAKLIHILYTIQKDLKNIKELDKMKLKYCLVACDLNNKYLHYYPFVKKYWKNIVGIDTILILISDHIPESLLEYKDDIILFEPIDNIPTAFQAQCIRVLYPCLIDTVENIIISDMDLIPLNKKYYVDNISLYSNSFVVYRNVIEEYKQYPICFCSASPYIWKEIFNIHSIGDITKTLIEWYKDINDYQVSSPYSIGWACDQLKLYEYVNKWNKSIIKLSDDITGFKRLDRMEIVDIKNNMDFYKKKIINGYYSDFHLPRDFEFLEMFLTFD